VNEIISLILNIFKKDKPDPSGSLLVFSVIFMSVFSFMMAGGTNSGNYSRFLPSMDHFHYLSSYIFILFLIFHIYRISRYYRFAHSIKTLVSIPILALFIAVFGFWEVKNIFMYKNYATPIVDTTGIKPVTVSQYSNLKGYYLAGHDDWFEVPSKACGTSRCHTEIVEQHSLSAHGRAFDNDVFKTQLKMFIDEKGRAAGDYCIACHAPLAVIKYPGDSPQAKEIDIFTTKDPAFLLGIGCDVCHRAFPDKNPSTFGNASFEILPLWLEKERYIGETSAEGQKIHISLINAAVGLHKKTYHISKEDSDYICAACHVVKLPGAFSCDGKERKAADQYTSFTESPYGKAGFTCASCHQQRFTTYEIGYNTVAHHYLGSGTSLPYEHKEDDRRFRDISLGFLNGLGDITLQANRLGLPPCFNDIDVYKTQYVTHFQRGLMNPFKGSNGGITQRYLLQTDLSIQKFSNSSVEVLVETTNWCSGHTFPSGGGIKAYLEILAFDKDGDIIGKYGGVDNNGRPYNTETTLGGRAADIHGEIIQDRRFWDACKAIYRKRLEPGESIYDTVILELKPDTKPAKIEATWYYLRPEYLRYIEGNINSPVSPVEIGKARKKITPSDITDFMTQRKDNY
ncbi:MAG: multiheme c-type cytochrome, partial [bacterium]